MAKDDTASIITLHQVKRPKTGADRARAYRERKKGKSELATVANLELPNFGNLPVPTEHAAGAPSMLTPVTPLPPPIVTFRHVTNVTPSRRSAGPVILMVAALGLAAVGICTNAWYARSLGATETAGTLFLAVGVASDLVALVMPSCPAGLWQSRQRATAVAGWMLWLATFAFALVSSVGFASVNIADVTMVRASRSTPAVTAAQLALGDAMAGRDRECAHGVEPFCRQREQAVVERRQALDAATQSVARAADPQAVAALPVAAARRPPPDDREGQMNDAAKPARA